MYPTIKHHVKSSNGGILEPVLMEKTFSLNVTPFLAMLMIRDNFWNILRLVRSVPFTIFVEIIVEKFPGTKLRTELGTIKTQLGFKQM